MEDVLEVYHRPHDPGRPVVCVDETAMISLTELSTNAVEIGSPFGHPAA
jgi:hypothetical protein